MAVTYKKNEENYDKLDLHFRYLFEGINFKERVIVLKGDIDDDKFTMVEAALTELESYNKKSITIKIFSSGGDVYSALAIVGRMKQSKCRIITEGYGSIMSAATLILAAGEHRRCSRFAFFMHHESSYTVEGRHSEVVSHVEQAKKQEDQWATWMAHFSKKPKKFYLDKGMYVDAYWTPDELVSFGVIDEIT